MQKLTLLSLILCVSWAANSQNRFGVNAGLNLSSLLYEEDQSPDFYSKTWKTKAGFRLGVFAEQSFNEKIGLHEELNYSLAGGRSVEFEDEKLDLHYISLPVAFYFKPIKWLKVYTGPEVNFLIKEVRPEAWPYPEDKPTKKMDYGVLVGAEFIPFQKWSISIRNYFGLQYNNEYTNVDEFFIFDFGTQKNNIFQVCVQYYIK